MKEPGPAANQDRHRAAGQEWHPAWEDLAPAARSGRSSVPARPSRRTRAAGPRSGCPPPASPRHAVRPRGQPGQPDQAVRQRAERGEDGDHPAMPQHPAAGRSAALPCAATGPPPAATAGPSRPGEDGPISPTGRPARRAVRQHQQRLRRQQPGDEDQHDRGATAIATQRPTAILPDQLDRQGHRAAITASAIR